MPIVSIVTVCLNAGSTIRSTMESVREQTYSHIQHIVVDGGSSDGTLEIVREYIDRRVTVRSEKDHGIYDAMNKGAKLSSGEVLGFLNADDFYAWHEALEHVASVFQDKSVDVCFGDVEYVDRHNPKLVLRYWQTGEFKQGRFALGWAPPHPAFFVRRSVFESAGGFNTNYKLASDNDLMMRVLECRAHKSKYLQEVLVKMRMGGETNKSFFNIVRGNREILRALKANGIEANMWMFLLRKAGLKINHYLAGLLRNQPMAA